MSEFLANESLLFLKSIGAIWEYPGNGAHGSYALSMRHSDFFFNSEILNTNPRLAKEFVTKFIVPKLENLENSVDWVCSYLPFGIGISWYVAEYLKCKIAFQDLNLADSTIDMISGGSKVLIVTDDLYTSTSLTKLISKLNEKNLEILNPIFVIGNFSGCHEVLGYPIAASFNKEVPRWLPEECPLCKKNSPVIEKVRYRWDKLIAETVK